MLITTCLTPHPKSTKDGSTTPTPIQQPQPWANQLLDEISDHNLQLSWDDEEPGDESVTTSNLFSVSENTRKLLQDSISKTTPNPTCKQLREKHGDPRCPPTRVPQLDKMVRDSTSQRAIKLDGSLARLQALCGCGRRWPTSDTFGAIAKQEQLTAEWVVTLTKLALRFEGNASIQISRERRKWAIEEMNGKLVELAEKDSIYEKAAPMQFGDQFAKEAKERTNCGPWIGLLTAQIFRDPRIFSCHPHSFN